MKQCEKYLENGERCSNRAVPGTYFCQTHGKIFFKPVKDEATVGKPDPGPPSEIEPTGVGPRAEPGPGKEKAVFPGLRVDERNILVAPQGVVLMESAVKAKPDDLFDRLVRLMSFLSQSMILSGQVRLMTSGADSEKALVFITPEHVEDVGLSALYDAVASAARLSGGGLCVGEGNAFVQYRDGRAPRGYDVPDFKPPTDSGKIVLVGRRGSQTFSLTEFSETNLSDFCLRIVTLPDVARPAPERVYALTPRPFYPVFCRYFRKHRLNFGLARLGASDDDPILFEICPRPDAADQTVPRFTLNYLAGMPRTTLLVPMHESGDRRILVEWEHRFPLRISAIAEAFDADETVLLMAGHYPNLRVRPTPRFLDGNRLMHVNVPRPDHLNVTPQPVEDETKLRQPVLLRPDTGPVPPIGALVLENRELSWVRTLLYQVPGETFQAFSLCQGEERSVLIGNRMAIEGIPFGIPLRRMNDAELFIPLRSRFVPDLPWEILRQALEIRDNVYTFFMDDCRIDIPASDFSPLSKSLVADPNRERIAFKIRPVAALPAMKWTPPPKEDDANGKEQNLPKKLRNLFSGNKKDKADLPAQPSDRDDVIQVPLREQAGIYEQENDFLAAAICYSMLKDTANSARCYGRAADFFAQDQPLPPIPEHKKNAKEA